MPSQAIPDEAKAQENSASIAGIQAMLLLDKLERLPEVFLSLVVVAHGVVGVGDVLAEGRPLSEDALHFVEEGQGLLELGLLPEDEGEGLDGLELVLVVSLAASRNDILEVCVHLVQPVELNAVVEKGKERLQSRFVVYALFLQQLLVPCLKLDFVLLLLFHPLGIVVVVLQGQHIEVRSHHIGTGHGLLLFLREAPPLLLILLLREGDDQRPRVALALDGPKGVVRLNAVGERVLEDGFACNNDC
mmetsp:Transcript_79613/g.165371  ORF Transcript_79613/g.165371 Transcript_79613/m.165371 type:complete len:246 (+) Transcript_79613:2043-2780(+)